jgi:ATP-dependent Zn protease
MNSKTRIAIISVVLICVAGVFWTTATKPRSLPTMTYSQFLEKVRSGEIAGVIVMGSDSAAIQAICRLKDGTEVQTYLPADFRDAMLTMQDKLVNVEIRDSSGGFLRLLLNAMPFLLLLGVWIFLMIYKNPNGRFLFPPMP